MPHFSNRRGVSSSGSSEERERRPGQRPGGVAPCRARLKGWLRNVASRSPIWGDVDLAAFCRITGYSREHATRELSKIRMEDHDLVFETKLRDKKPKGRRTWGVIVAQCAKLKFDKCSLFYDAQGCRLHNYTKLGDGGKKMEPIVILQSRSPRPRGRPRKFRNSPAANEPRTTNDAGARESKASVGTSCTLHADNPPKNTAGCDIPYIRKDSFGIQQPELNDARRDFAQWRGFESKSCERRHGDPLRRKAFSLSRRLEDCHWDNCKVRFVTRTAFGYAHRSLRDGHDEERVVSCYADALMICHGFAVDRACSAGRITFFAPSSTVSKAERLLAKDGLSREQRMAQWYERRRRTEPVLRDENFDPDELAEIRRAIAESFHSAEIRDRVGCFRRLE